MERERQIKVVVIITLVVIVIGLSVGFAAFSTTLSISSSANVLSNTGSFSVVFSSASSNLQLNSVVPKTYPSNIDAGNAIISNGSVPSITNLSATFTEPGQSVVYSFYAHNNGEYDAYLNDIIYENVLGKNSNKICTSINGGNSSSVQSACNDISLKVKVGNDSIVNRSVSGINSHILKTNSYENIIVTLEYVSSNKVDEDFSVDFGNISLSYSSVD